MRDFRIKSVGDLANGTTFTHNGNELVKVWDRDLGWAVMDSKGNRHVMAGKTAVRVEVTEARQMVDVPAVVASVVRQIAEARRLAS
jgi:hypothetical protein